MRLGVETPTRMPINMRFISNLPGGPDWSFFKRLRQSQPPAVGLVSDEVIYAYTGCPDGGLVHSMGKNIILSQKALY